MGILPLQGENLESNVTTGVLALWPARPRVQPLAMLPHNGETSAISFSFAYLTKKKLSPKQLPFVIPTKHFCRLRCRSVFKVFVCKAKLW